MANTRSVAILLSGLAALGPFSVDTYFPSFPSIAAHYGVSPLAVQATLSGYLLALAGMSLFHGALADAFGRRPVLLWAMGVYTLCAFVCPFAPTFHGLVACRVAQGLAAGAGMIVGRAVIRDRFGSTEAQRFMSQVTVVGGLGPAVAPIVGGWLHAAFGWRSPFIFLGILGTVLVWGCYRGLPESLPANARQSFHPAKLTSAYGEACRNPAFMALSLSLSAGAGGFLLYVATAPDVVLNILKLSETEFGWMFIPLVTGMITGSALSARLAGAVPPTRLIRRGFALMAAAVVLNVAIHLWTTPRVPWAVLPLPIYTFGFSLFAPAATILCLDLMPERRGLASSLQGFMQVLVFALVSGVVAALVYRSGLKHALAMAALLTIAWVSWLGYSHFSRSAQTGHRTEALGAAD